MHKSTGAAAPQGVGNGKPVGPVYKCVFEDRKFILIAHPVGIRGQMNYTLMWKLTIFTRRTYAKRLPSPDL